MFDGEIVKKKFPYKKILELENFWPRQIPKQSKAESKTESKTNLDLENFNQEILFAKRLKISHLMEKL